MMKVQTVREKEGVFTKMKIEASESQKRGKVRNSESSSLPMFCFQCQETAKNTGCTNKGVCGKTDGTARLQDLLIYVLKGISIYGRKAAEAGVETVEAGRFVTEALFATVTNVNFDEGRFEAYVRQALDLRDELRGIFEQAHENRFGSALNSELPECAMWRSSDIEEFHRKARQIGAMSVENEDIRSLRELLIYGLKGLAAYTHHAAVLGYEDHDIYSFIMEALASTTEELATGDMIEYVLRAGEMGVKGMALLDRANTETFGHPEVSEVNLGVRSRPGILISGHDLRDLDELLKQTEGTGVDVYTHGEMLPAHYYPAFKKYDHLAGNYGNSWWKQGDEFTSFNGPILMTTNCLIPVRDEYRDRIFTTGLVGFDGVKHVPDRKDGQPKDFSEVIELAKTCESPTQLETGTIIGGFAHNQVEQLADKVTEAVKSGAVKRFIVMAGCDGRHKTRSYFTEIAEMLPENTVILTAGCAKYRYNKLNLGDIEGIPRVLDAGQCNDSYSLALTALKLKEAFGLDDINDLPISYDIAWYEQKAVIVLLALLHLGVKNIHLGPTLPAFLSPNVANVLVEKFNIKPTTTVEEDLAALV